MNESTSETGPKVEPQPTTSQGGLGMTKEIPTENVGASPAPGKEIGERQVERIVDELTGQSKEGRPASKEAPRETPAARKVVERARGAARRFVKEETGSWVPGSLPGEGREAGQHLHHPEPTSGEGFEGPERKSERRFRTPEVGPVMPGGPGGPEADEAARRRAEEEFYRKGIEVGAIRERLIMSDVLGTTDLGSEGYILRLGRKAYDNPLTINIWEVEGFENRADQQREKYAMLVRRTTPLQRQRLGLVMPFTEEQQQELIERRRQRIADMAKPIPPLKPEDAPGWMTEQIDERNRQIALENSRKAEILKQMQEDEARWKEEKKQMYSGLALSPQGERIDDETVKRWVELDNEAERVHASFLGQATIILDYQYKYRYGMDPRYGMAVYSPNRQAIPDVDDYIAAVDRGPLREGGVERREIFGRVADKLAEIMEGEGVRPWTPHDLDTLEAKKEAGKRADRARVRLEGVLTRGTLTSDRQTSARQREVELRRIAAEGIEAESQLEELPPLLKDIIRNNNEIPDPDVMPDNDPRKEPYTAIRNHLRRYWGNRKKFPIGNPHKEGNVPNLWGKPIKNVHSRTMIKEFVVEGVYNDLKQDSEHAEVRGFIVEEDKEQIEKEFYLAYAMFKGWNVDAWAEIVGLDLAQDEESGRLILGHLAEQRGLLDEIRGKYKKEIWQMNKDELKELAQRYELWIHPRYLAIGWRRGEYAAPLEVDAYDRNGGIYGLVEWVGTRQLGKVASGEFHSQIGAPGLVRGIVNPLADTLQTHTLEWEEPVTALNEQGEWERSAATFVLSFFDAWRREGIPLQDLILAMDGEKYSNPKIAAGIPMTVDVPRSIDFEWHRNIGDKVFKIVTKHVLTDEFVNAAKALLSPNEILKDADAWKAGFVASLAKRGLRGKRRVVEMPNEEGEMKKYWVNAESALAKVGVLTPAQVYGANWAALTSPPGVEEYFDSDNPVESELKGYLDESIVFTRVMESLRDVANNLKKARFVGRSKKITIQSEDKKGGIRYWRLQDVAQRLFVSIPLKHRTVRTASGMQEIELYSEVPRNLQEFNTTPLHRFKIFSRREVEFLNYGMSPGLGHPLLL